MRKNTLLIAGIITALIGVGGAVFSASAAPGGLSAGKAGWSGMMSDQWRENMQNARQNNDYNSWRSLAEERHSRMLEWMTPDKFSKMNEMRNLMREGKADEANKIRKELGMPERNEKGKAGGWRGLSADEAGNCWR